MKQEHLIRSDVASRGLDAVIIGGGLAGCEAAWQLLSRGVPVVLYEMRGTRSTQAHVTEDLAELVCSNSFRSDDVETAVGLLHAEMRIASSLILEAADATRVPSGSALAVDRVGFAKYVMGKLLSHPFFTLKREEVTQIPEGRVIVATGPLTSDDFASQLLRVTQEGYLAFFDAIAPIVHKDSIDFSKSWFQSRYDKGEGFDYINCPLDKEQYESFVTLLLDGEKIEFKEWEKTTPYFNGCLPIEVIAFRGRESLRFGPMKPVGLTDPNTGKRPYAVVQLRQDNKIGTLYNIVGFQTKLKYSDQVRIFRTIPGLEKAEFARLGGLHRNTFINSPKLLEANLSLKSAPDIKVAGQITGVEGYLESAAIGLLAGLFTNFELRGEPLIFPPKDTALGALLRHITTNAHSETFQPMNINYGLFEELDGVSRQANKKQLYSNRALAQAKAWVINLNDKLGESYV